jgi:hypothetical protein
MVRSPARRSYHAHRHVRKLCVRNHDKDGHRGVGQLTPYPFHLLQSRGRKS